MNTPSVNTLSKQHLETSSISCPTQVLVLDRVNGPAEILMDTVSRLVDTDVSITCIGETSDALDQLECGHYDLLVIGIHDNATETLSVLPYLQVQRPDVPVIVAGWQIRKADQECARYFDVKDVIRLPNKASKMKALASYVEILYLA